MDFFIIDGKEVRVSFWTNDQRLLLDLRKLLMQNMVKFTWKEKKKRGFALKAGGVL